MSRRDSPARKARLRLRYKTDAVYREKKLARARERWQRVKLSPLAAEIKEISNKLWRRRQTLDNLMDLENYRRRLLLKVSDEIVDLAEKKAKLLRLRISRRDKKSRTG